MPTLTDALCDVLAAKAARIAQAAKPGQTVCLRCEATVAVSEWQGQCPSCGHARGWTVESKEVVSCHG